MKKLSCVVGRHDWKTHIGQGQSYERCEACGKLKKPPGNPPMSGTDVSWQKMGP